MTRSPLVSVVVLNYNYDGYLGAAIDSALAQTYPQVEVVVVDDGSTDGSRRVIAGYGTDIFPVLRPNGGQTAAMNSGLRAASGELLCFLDADDVLHADALETAVPLLDDPSVLKVHWPLVEIDGAGVPAGRLWPREPLPEGDLLGVLLARGPANCAFPPQSGNLFRRRIVASAAPLPCLEHEFRRGSASADYYLSMVAAAEGRIRTADRPLGCYRVHGRNDFAGEDAERVIARAVGISDFYFERLACRLASRGVAADVAAWRRQSWFHQLAALLDDVAGVVAEGGTWVLVDNDLTGLRRSDRWNVRGFVERDGEYWGPPHDCADAILELDRLRGAGAEVLVFSWLARWWFDVYPDLIVHLTEHHPIALETGRALAFDLTRRASTRRSSASTDPWCKLVGAGA